MSPQASAAIQGLSTSRPIRSLGMLVIIGLRVLFAVFWLAAGYNKLNKDWLTSDILYNIFADRLTQLPPDAFAVFYLQSFAMPLYVLIAWIVTLGEIYAGLGLLLGLTTRIAAAVSFFILINLAIGGYYDASLLPFFILNLAFLWWSTGRWFGVDALLARKFPEAIWFK